MTSSPAVLASVNTNVSTEENSPTSSESGVHNQTPIASPTSLSTQRRTLHKKKSSGDLRDDFYQASFELHQVYQDSKEKPDST
ncbi:hypothetical protein D9757_005778 [Collybiopsis confluens]|uniref:Uncharacterized protein n=1 Tax=Collybiopsis confluens TaxID=2823264 RepID=A0A8H5HQA2_9AGAR|nr:hypothetical protein D9757_005778 [Collybiopsis confluens]